MKWQAARKWIIFHSDEFPPKQKAILNPELWLNNWQWHPFLFFILSACKKHIWVFDFVKQKQQLIRTQPAWHTLNALSIFYITKPNVHEQQQKQQHCFVGNLFVLTLRRLQYTKNILWEFCFIVILRSHSSMWDFEAYMRIFS